MIVDEDADIEEAAEAACGARMTNAGQTCIGIERVYVDEPVYDQFVDEVVEQARGLKRRRRRGQIGPMTMPAQSDVIRAHLEDARRQGRQGPDRRPRRDRACGGRTTSSRPCSPTSRTNSLEMTDETFGPTLADQPGRRAWTRRSSWPTAPGTAWPAPCSRKRARHGDRRRLRAGMTSVNSVSRSPAIPALPFGGVGESGFGRIHGADGLKEFTYAHAITDRRFKSLLALTTFNRSARTEKTADRLDEDGLRPLTSHPEPPRRIGSPACYQTDEKGTR